MKLTRYQKLLLADGVYDSVQSFRPTWLDRLFWWSTLRFHARVIGVVVKASILCFFRLFDSFGWSKIQQYVLRSAEGAGARVRIEGVRSILDTPGPFVYAANHMSLLETFTLPLALLLASPVSIVVKRELLQYPVFKRVLKTVAHPIAVARLNPREDMQTILQRGQEALDAGRSVLIFPQSIRSLTFDRRRFNSIAARLAERAGRPLVPIALRTDFMEMGRIVQDFGPLNRRAPVRFRIGPVLAPGQGRRALQARTVEFIESCLVEWNVPVRNGHDCAGGLELEETT